MKRVRGRLTFDFSGEVESTQELSDEVGRAGQTQILKVLEKYRLQVEPDPVMLDFDYRQE